MSNRSALVLEDDVALALSELSEAMHRSPSEIVNETLRARFSHSKAFSASIARGLGQLDRGKGVSTRELRRRLAAARQARR